jgi:hypothetical protein
MTTLNKDEMTENAKGGRLMRLAEALKKIEKVYGIEESRRLTSGYTENEADVKFAKEQLLESLIERLDAGDF